MIELIGAALKGLKCAVIVVLVVMASVAVWLLAINMAWLIWNWGVLELIARGYAWVLWFLGAAAAVGFVAVMGHALLLRPRCRTRGGNDG